MGLLSLLTHEQRISSLRSLELGHRSGLLVLGSLLRVVRNWWLKWCSGRSGSDHWGTGDHERRLGHGGILSLSPYGSSFLGMLSRLCLIDGVEQSSHFGCRDPFVQAICPDVASPDNDLAIDKTLKLFRRDRTNLLASCVCVVPVLNIAHCSDV